jgi:hypothetical protein
MLKWKGCAAAIGIAAVMAAATPAMAKWTNQNSADAMAIQNLLGRYMHALDTANADAYAMVFAPDGEMGAGNMAEKGRDNLKKYVEDLRKSWGLPNDGKEHWGRTRHIFYNLHIDEIDGKHASGGTYWQTLIGDAESGTWKVLATGVSNETYSKIDGEWYIQTRTVAGDPKPMAGEGGEH